MYNFILRKKQKTSIRSKLWKFCMNFCPLIKLIKITLPNLPEEVTHG